MALLFSPPLLSASSVASTPMIFISSSSSSSMVRGPSTSIGLNHQLHSGLWIHTSSVKYRGCIVTRAAEDDQGPAPEAGKEKTGDEEKTGEEKTGDVQPSTPVEKLPLESKLKMQLEQKLRMKAAKKIRLRRKRLLRKRRMRKKGRWPPSKMKKNKNV
ncbi:Large ribosomal subunit protein cL37 alpha-like protein [Drosera capensis]